MTSCMTVWYGNSTVPDQKALQQVVIWVRGVPGDTVESLGTTHPTHHLFIIIPSAIGHTTRLRDSLYPRAVKLLVPTHTLWFINREACGSHSYTLVSKL